MSNSVITSERKRKKNRLGMIIFLVFFAIMFLGIPSIGIVSTVSDMRQEMASKDWVETPCVIHRAEVKVDRSSESPFMPEVNFSYEFGGEKYHSDSFTLNNKHYSDYTEAWLMIKEFKDNKESNCFVNPADPQQVKLKHESIRTFIGIIIFCGAFILIGITVIVILIRQIRKGSVKKARKIDSGISRKVLWIIGLSFFVMGIVFVIFSTINRKETKEVLEHWKPVPCEIIHSKIHSKRNDDSTTYSVSVFYKYQFQEKEYKSNNYGASGSGSSNYGDKRKELDLYQPGSKHDCYVNPDEPWFAILAPERKSSAMLVFMIVGAVFTVAGIGLTIFAWKRKKEKTDKSKVSRFNRNFSSNRTEPVVSKRQLKMKHSRLKSFLLAILVACFWNGIVSFFVIEMLDEKSSGPPVWFMIPFIIVGLGLCINVLFCLGRLFSPKVNITIFNDGCRVGEALQIEWQADLNRLKTFHIELHCEQVAQRGSGDSSKEITQLSERLILLDSTHDLAMLRDKGIAKVNIPITAMHSWEANESKIVWKIVCYGRVKIFPNIKDTSIITINPREAVNHG